MNNDEYTYGKWRFCFIEHYFPHWFNLLIFRGSQQNCCTVLLARDSGWNLKVIIRLLISLFITIDNLNPETELLQLGSLQLCSPLNFVLYIKFHNCGLKIYIVGHICRSRVPSGYIYVTSLLVTLFFEQRRNPGHLLLAGRWLMVSRRVVAMTGHSHY